MPGLGSQFGMKKETTWGTAVTVDKFFEYTAESLSLDQTYADPATLRAGRTFASSGQTKKTTRRAGGDIALPVPTKLFGAILDLMVSGTITPAVVTGTAYASTFNIGASVPDKSATLQINKPFSDNTAKAFTYPGGVLTSASFTLSSGGYLDCTTTWLAKDETTPDTTPAGAALATASYATGVRMWVHTDVATLTIGGSPAAAVTDINWTWSQPMAEDRDHLGVATRAKPVVTGLATVEGSMTCEWTDTTFYSLFRSGAFASLVFSVADDTAITGSTYPTLLNTFAAVQIRGSSPVVNGPDLLTNDVPFVVKDNGSNPPWAAVYTSTDSAAW